MLTIAHDAKPFLYTLRERKREARGCKGEQGKKELRYRKYRRSWKAGKESEWKGRIRGGRKRKVVHERRL